MGFIRDGFEKTLQRYDELPYLTYFKISDFPGLKAKSYTFKSGENKLQGYFYHYQNYDKDIIVIFCHGIGGGHSAYMHEIEILAKNGYLVLGYDNTGCIESEGINNRGLAESLKDLDNAIKSLKNKKEYKDKKIYVVGHSWGGFAASNIYNYQNVDKVVAISPFISLKQIYKDFIHFPLSIVVIPGIIALEKENVGEYAKSNAIKALNRKNVKALIVHSKDDRLVKYKLNTAILQKKVHNPNVEFLILDKKDHHPQYTLDAVQYFNQIFDTFNKEVKLGGIQTLEQKKQYFSSVNFKALVKQDKNVWDKIISFLSKN